MSKEQAIEAVTPDLTSWVLAAHLHEFLVTEGYHANYVAAKKQAEKFASEAAPFLAPVLAAAVREGKAEALREAAEWLPSATEGPLRVGTALWPECDRDAYSLAIEESRRALRDRADHIAGDAPEGGAS